MNYGLAQMARGDYPDAYSNFERAAVLLPNYYVLEINRGVVNGAMHRNAEAEQRFIRAVSLAPNQSDPKFYYARWLGENATLFNGDPTAITASGHSAGAHLAFYLIARGPAEAALPQTFARRATTWCGALRRVKKASQ